MKQLSLTTSRLTPLLFPLLWAPVAGAMPRPNVENVTTTGPGCPTGTVYDSLTPTAEGEWSFDLVFANLEAISEGGRNQTEQMDVDCRIGARVTPPVGYRMRIASELVQGYHSVIAEGGRQAKAEVWAGFSLLFPNGKELPGLDFNVNPAQGVTLRGDRTQDLRIANVQGIPSTEGNWAATVEDTAHIWTPCNTDGQQWVQLKAWAHLDSRRASDNHPAIIALQRQSHGMGWGWFFEPCSSGGNGGQGKPGNQRQQDQNQQQNQSSATGKWCRSDADLSDATRCGAPDSTGFQWWCSAKNNWCVVSHGISAYLNGNRK